MNKKKQIKHIAKQLIELGNNEIIETSFTVDYLAHAENKEYQGHKFLKKFSKLMHNCLPDIRVIEIKFLAEEGNTICWQRRLKGTHRQNMMGIPASNKQVQWNEMIVSRFEGDQIAEEWLVSELAAQLLLKQCRK